MALTEAFSRSELRKSTICRRSFTIKPLISGACLQSTAQQKREKKQLVFVAALKVIKKSSSKRGGAHLDSNISKLTHILELRYTLLVSKFHPTTFSCFVQLDLPLMFSYMAHCCTYVACSPLLPSRCSNIVKEEPIFIASTKQPWTFSCKGCTRNMTSPAHIPH